MMNDRKDKLVSLRLSKEEYQKLEKDSQNRNMKTSEYLRSLISDTAPQQNLHQQEIAAALCNIYILMEEKGLDDSPLTKEVHHLCQILS